MSDLMERVAGRPGTEIAPARDNAAATVLSVIAQAATDPRVDVTKMQALLEMQRQLLADQARAAFNEAFARLQAKLPRVKKNGDVFYPVNKNNPDGPQRHAFKYAKWEDIDDAIRPLLIDEGFALSYDTRILAEGRVVIIGKLLHREGHEKTAEIGPLPLDTSGGKNNLQGAGSTFSYGKRYAATALLNLVFEGEDDDGVLGGTEFITDQQVKQLSDLLMSTRSDLNRFLDLMGVRSLGEIRKEDHAAALNAIASKMAKVGPRDA